LGFASSLFFSVPGAAPNPVKDFPAPPKLEKVEAEGLADPSETASFSSDFGLAPNPPKDGVAVALIGDDPNESPEVGVAVVDAAGAAGAVGAEPKENPVNDLAPVVLEGAEVSGCDEEDAATGGFVPNENPDEEEAGAGAGVVSAGGLAPKERPTEATGGVGLAEPKEKPEEVEAGADDPKETPVVDGLARVEASLFSFGATGAGLPKEIGVVEEEPKERVVEEGG
jgi:hypothetical protein